MLAGVSLDYYARLEQGRDLQPSDQVLDAIARALRLAEVERTHLHNLVRSAAVAAPGELRLPPLDAGTQLMLASIEIPGLILDSRGDIHAMNPMGRALLAGLEPLPASSSNHTRWLFTDPGARELLADWEVVARATVGVLRETAGRYPHDPHLHALVGELSVTSVEFRAWWADHEVDTRCSGPKRFRHPVVGDIVVHIEALQLRDGERWLYTYSAEPGSRSAEAMRLLGSWSASPAHPAASASNRPSDAAELG